MCLGDSTRFVNTTVVQQGTTLKLPTWRFWKQYYLYLSKSTVLYTIPKTHITVTLRKQRASDGAKPSFNSPFEMNDKPNADFKTYSFLLNSSGKVPI